MIWYDTVQYDTICWLVWPIVRLLVRSIFPFPFARSTYFDLIRYDMQRNDTILVCFVLFYVRSTDLLIRYDTIDCLAVWSIDRSFADSIVPFNVPSIGRLIRYDTIRYVSLFFRWGRFSFSFCRWPFDLLPKWQIFVWIFSSWSSGPEFGLLLVNKNFYWDHHG